MTCSPSQSWLMRTAAACWLLQTVSLACMATNALAEEPAKPKAPEKKVEKKAEKPAADKYIRVVRNASGAPLTMDTAIVRFVPVDDKHPGLAVDLVAAVHIADKAYYDELNKRFATYESMLYELVAPEGTKIPKGGAKGGGTSMVGSIQVAMKNMLALEFQLEMIDYTKANFVHADMSPEEFSKSMADKGESMLQMFFDMMAKSMAQQAKGKGGGAGSEVDLFLALFAKDRPLKMKQVMAAQFEDMDDMLSNIGGKSGSTIINERNNKALAVLKKEITAGKKKIAIFYGAGHMQDIEAKLLKDFGLKREKVDWLPAWKLSK